MERRDVLKLSSAILGYSLAGGTVAAVLAGCKANVNLKPEDLDLFDQDTYNLLVDITERILPATDTPGAKDANVVSYIHDRLKNFSTKEENMKWFTDLKMIDQSAMKSYNAKYNKLSSEEKNDLLTNIQLSATVDSDHIFNTLKEETMVGFFTSEIGATQVLKHDPIPTAYNGCIDYLTGQPAWSI